MVFLRSIIENNILVPLRPAIYIFESMDKCLYVKTNEEEMKKNEKFGNNINNN